MINKYPTQLLNDTTNSVSIINAALTRTQDSFLQSHDQKDAIRHDFYYSVYKELDSSSQISFHMDFFINLFEEYAILLNPTKTIKQKSELNRVRFY